MANVGEIIAFVLYILLVIGVGVFFLFKDKNQKGEKDFFLGGRQLNGLVAALSAGASDMSAWVLMGLPGAIYMYGLGQVWISVGLVIGTILAWIFVAPRLRRYAILAKDSITIPQYLTNRFLTDSKLLQVVCAVIFMIVYCIYGASSIKACGTLFNTLFGLDERIAMAISAVVIILYVFMGGFNAVCWTDFFQGMLMLLAMMITPIVAVAVMNKGDVSSMFVASEVSENYYNLLSSGKFDWESISTILTGLGWGLGYFGMPHIIVRYISIKSEKEMKRSQIVGSFWTTIICAFAVVVAIVGRKYFGAGVEGTKEQIFVLMARDVFPAFIGGIIITAILAASMSTADSQLLASSSAFASDVYKSVLRKNANDKEIMWVGRIVIIVISVLAFVIAFLGTGEKPIVSGFSTIMGLVDTAWSAFGASFGPIILLSLYWRRLNYKGATAGIIVGFVVDIIWLVLFDYGAESVVYNTGLYEIIPGFICGLLAAVITSLCTEAPSKEITDLFDKVNAAKNVES